MKNLMINKILHKRHTMIKSIVYSVRFYRNKSIVSGWDNLMIWKPSGRAPIIMGTLLAGWIVISSQQLAYAAPPTSCPPDCSVNVIQDADDITIKTQDGYTINQEEHNTIFNGPEAHGAFSTEIFSSPCWYIESETLQNAEELRNGQSESPQGGLEGGSWDCRPETPQFNLAQEPQVLQLPTVKGGAKVLFLLDPPSNVLPGYTAEIVEAQGSFSSETLYEEQGTGRLYLRPVWLVSGETVVTTSADGNELLLYTPGDHGLSKCARSETFRIKLTHVDGVTESYFRVTLPVAFKVHGFNADIRPGQVVDLHPCANGDQGPRTWSWIHTSGDPFPPPGLSFDPSDGTITGTPQTWLYRSEGRIHLQEGTKVGEASASFQISQPFHAILEEACSSKTELGREQFFTCELQRPLAVGPHDSANDYTWQVVSGNLPEGLNLVDDGYRYYVEGTPERSVEVRSYPVDLELRTSSGALLYARQITFHIGIAFSVWTQNAILRPNNPIFPNTGDDNEERADLILNHLNNFDIVALQEVFDDDQTSQIINGAFPLYDFAKGPDESRIAGVTTTEDSGLILLIRWDLTNSSTVADPLIERLRHPKPNHSEIFTAECESDDCWAHKGFSITKVRFRGHHAFNPSAVDEYIYVVNTHLQSAYDSSDQYSATRLAQLEQIIDHIDEHTEPTHPVLFMGDLNVVGGSSEYDDRFGDVFNGTFLDRQGRQHDLWDDLVKDKFNDPARPFTIDKTRNAYAHFWDGDHLLDHQLEQIAQNEGQIACLSRALILGGSNAPCFGPYSHPDTKERLDYILVRQGTRYKLAADSIQVEEASPITDMCHNNFPMHHHPMLECYLSDHFGLSAELRFTRQD